MISAPGIKDFCSWVQQKSTELGFERHPLKEEFASTSLPYVKSCMKMAANIDISRACVTRSYVLWKNSWKNFPHFAEDI